MSATENNDLSWNNEKCIQGYLVTFSGGSWSSRHRCVSKANVNGIIFNITFILPDKTHSLTTFRFNECNILRPFTGSDVRNQFVELVYMTGYQVGPIYALYLK